jgi:hypothetical protein
VVAETSLQAGNANVARRALERSVASAERVPDGAREEKERVFPRIAAVAMALDRFDLAAETLQRMPWDKRSWHMAKFVDAAVTAGQFHCALEAVDNIWESTLKVPCLCRLAEAATVAKDRAVTGKALDLAMHAAIDFHPPSGGVHGRHHFEISRDQIPYIAQVATATFQSAMPDTERQAWECLISITKGLTKQNDLDQAIISMLKVAGTTRDTGMLDDIESLVRSRLPGASQSGILFRIDMVRARIGDSDRRRRSLKAVVSSISTALVYSGNRCESLAEVAKAAAENNDRHMVECALSAAMSHPETVLELVGFLSEVMAACHSGIRIGNGYWGGEHIPQPSPQCLSQILRTVSSTAMRLGQHDLARKAVRFAVEKNWGFMELLHLVQSVASLRRSVSPRETLPFNWRTILPDWRTELLEHRPPFAAQQLVESMTYFPFDNDLALDGVYSLLTLLADEGINVALAIIGECPELGISYLREHLGSGGQTPALGSRSGFVDASG